MAQIVLTDPSQLHSLLSQQGYLLFLLLSVIEGPLVTIVAAALAQEGLLDLRLILPLAILGDLLGDVVVHLIGRFAAGAVPDRLRHRLGLDRHVVTPLVQAFGQKGGRLLILAKLTHFAGLPMLFASGVARMAFLPFLGVSLIATLPKTLLLCALGWSFGLTLSHMTPSLWLAPLATVLTLGALFLYSRKQGRRCA